MSPVFNEYKFYKRNRKYVTCIELQRSLEAWENEKCCGKTSQQASVSTAFLSFLKVPQVFLLNS